jgi:hypothetical protein
MQDLTDETIIEKTTSAFLPLRCVAEIWDYDFKLRFKVFDKNGKEIIEVPDITLDKVREEHQLDELLSLVRSRLEEKGFTLN